MTAHLDWETINDYADDALAADARRAASAHLDSCHDCRAQVADLRAFLSSLGSAPRSIDPPNDVWGALRHTLERGKVVGLPGLRAAGSAWRMIPRQTWRMLAAAAVVLVAASSTLTAFLLRRDANHAAVSQTAAPGTPAAYAIEVAQVERGYLESVVELTQALDAARPHLAPGTIAIVERNLAVIDAAIAESRAALLRDPGNRALLEVLSGTYRQKLDLLRRAAQLAAS